MRHSLAWALGGLLGVVSVGGTPVAAQQRDTSMHGPVVVRAPESAGLLRRLAEAADGYRTGRRIWIVASRQPPYDVGGVFASETTAVHVARDSGELWGSFGPYVTPRDLGQLPVFIIAPPMHCRPTIVCWDVWVQTPDTSWLEQDIDSLVVTAYHHSGRMARDRVSPDVDAIFFSLSAFDKFAIPYYSALSGPEFALRLRQSVISRIHVP